MRKPAIFILIVASLSVFVACQPEKTASVEPPVPVDQSQDLPVAEPSAPVVVEPVVEVVHEALRPSYTPQAMRRLTDVQGRPMQARVIAANEDQVRIQRADGAFFTVELATLSEADQGHIGDLQNLPELDAAVSCALRLVTLAP